MNNQSAREVRYHYDVDADANPSPPSQNPYGSFNNRLMYEELRDSWTLDVLSTTYYEYSADGNVTRVITEQPAILSPPMEFMMSGGETELELEGSTAAPAVDEDGGEVMAAGGGGGGGGGPCDGMKTYTGTRFGYARNGQTVTFVHDESWCWDQVSSCEVPGSYQITWAREFRYDGARARYMNRPLDIASLWGDPAPHATLSTLWTDYDGDETYGDYRVTAGTPPTVEQLNAYEPGLWRQVGLYKRYVHNDHLGTLRLTTSVAGPEETLRVFTAFGEKIAGNQERLGYVGAWGYQSTPIPETLTPDPFPFLHVGARYYDPSSGRFLQRDPIGISGGVNVYQYAAGIPTAGIDPLGFSVGLLPGPQKKPWDPLGDPNRPRPRPVPKPAPPPQNIVALPVQMIINSHETLILAGPGMYAAIIGDAVMTVFGVPIWYDGEGGEWFYNTKRMLKLIKQSMLCQELKW